MDKYDQQIEILTSKPFLIPMEWAKAEGIFKRVGPLACLTFIRKESEYSVYINGEPDMELTKEIRDDERIPKQGVDIKVEHLPVFAEWQRRIDALNKPKI